MFGMKLLSIVSALFIGTQLMLTNAEITTCDTVNGFLEGVCSNTSTTDKKYCLNTSENKIYSYVQGANSSDPCDKGQVKTINSNGLVVIHDGDEVSTLGSSATDLESAINVAPEKLVMYQCSFENGSASCYQTYGYILVGSTTYVIPSGGNSAEVLAFDSSVVGNKFVQTCSGNEGLLNDVDSDNVGLCLAGGKMTQKIDNAGSKKYIMTNSDVNIFKSGGTSTDYIVVEVGDNAITYVESGYDYCIKTGDELSETFKEICGDDGSDADPCHTLPYSECENGLCTREIVDNSCKMKADGETNGNCNTPGYYVLKTTGAVNDLFELVLESDADETVGKLYYCSSANVCNPVSTGFQQGYYKNAASTGNSDAYFKCTAVNSCTKVAIDLNCTNAGSIVNDGGLKICLEAGASVSPVVINSSATLQNQFISLANDSVFGNMNEGKYVSIDVKDGNILLTTPGLVNAAQKYYYTDEINYKIHLKSQNSAICSATIVEFKLDRVNSVDSQLIVYTKHAIYDASL